MKKRSLALAVLLGFLAAGLSAQVLLVSAAASLTDVLTSLKSDAEKAIGMPIQLNFGGSGTLRKQIEEGAPVDVFFSAAAEDMDKLSAAKLLLAGSRSDLLSNSIVLVGPASIKPATTKDDVAAILAGSRTVAIGNPDSVPAGRYATQAFAFYGFDAIVKGRLALGGSVREVLQFVQSGAASVGVVFSTDALTARDLVVLYRFPASSLRTPVIYPISALAASKHVGAAEAFIAFLKTEAARAAFEKAGFALP